MNDKMWSESFLNILFQIKEEMLYWWREKKLQYVEEKSSSQKKAKKWVKDTEALVKHHMSIPTRICQKNILFFFKDTLKAKLKKQGH